MYGGRLHEGGVCVVWQACVVCGVAGEVRRRNGIRVL